jgi:hypothetical protein
VRAGPECVSWHCVVSWYLRRVQVTVHVSAGAPFLSGVVNLELLGSAELVVNSCVLACWRGGVMAGDS